MYEPSLKFYGYIYIHTCIYVYVFQFVQICIYVETHNFPSHSKCYWQQNKLSSYAVKSTRSNIYYCVYQVIRNMCIKFTCLKEASISIIP